MAQTLYFDANVYDHIDKGYITLEEVDALRAVMAHDKYTVSLSITNVEELLGEWKTDRTAAVRKVCIARDLVGFEDILKQPSDLLRDAFRAYATGKPLPSQILPQKECEILANYLNRIANGDRHFDNVVSKIVEHVRMMKQHFCGQMALARAEVLTDWEMIDLNERKQMTFEKYWTAGATQFAEGFIPPDCLGACRARGLDGLLEVRAIRLCVGALMSSIYSQTVGDGSQPRQPRPHDTYDLWHAVLASVANIFVTRDDKLAKLLRRVPIDDFRVVTALSEIR